MPRYFFDTSRDGETHEDRFGIDLLDLPEAKLQACTLLSDMTQDDDPACEHAVLTCDVLDSDRRVVYRATLRCEAASA